MWIVLLLFFSVVYIVSILTVLDPDMKSDVVKKEVPSTPPPRPEKRNDEIIIWLFC